MNFKTILANVNGDSYFAHRVVESSFPCQKKAFYRKGDTLVVYSERGPVSPFAHEVYILETCEFSIDEILQNKHKMFSLEVNPTKRVNMKYSKITKNEIEEWMNRKLEAMGCILKQCIPMRADWDIFEQGDKNNKISMYCHEVMGMLEIVNDQQFKANYFNGIGQGKSFGYGLLNFLN